MRLFAGTKWDIPPTCDRCGKLVAECKCPPAPPPPPERSSPQSQTAKLSVQKRARGKIVTVVAGLAEPATDLAELLIQLKNRCGAGGTRDNDTLEIQGSHVDRIRTILQEMGYKVKG